MSNSAVWLRNLDVRKGEFSKRDQEKLNLFSEWIKVRPRAGNEGPKGEYNFSSTLSLTSALDRVGWLTPRPDRFTPGKETRYPLYRRLGGPQVRSRQVRSPDRPARRQSLYRLSSRGPLWVDQRNTSANKDAIWKCRENAQHRFHIAAFNRCHGEALVSFCSFERNQHDIRTKNLCSETMWLSEYN